MSAPIGNQNAAKAKQWAAAIERALERRGDPSIDPDQPIARSPKAKAMDDMAEKFLGAVETSGIVGYREFGDRIDGKPHQTLSGPNDSPLIGGIDVTLHSTAVRQTVPDEQNKG